MLCALLASRGSEVAGLQVGDVDWDQRIVTIRRQTFPGSGGLVTKQTKGREIRHVPILQHLAPVLKRLTARSRTGRSGSSPGHVAGSSPLRRFATQPSGTRSSQTLGYRISRDMAFGTPARPGSQTQEFHCTSSRASSGTSLSKLPVATSTPTPGTSPMPQHKQMRSSIARSCRRHQQRRKAANDRHRSGDISLFHGSGPGLVPARHNGHSLGPESTGAAQRSDLCINSPRERRSPDEKSLPSGLFCRADRI